MNKKIILLALPLFALGLASCSSSEQSSAPTSSEAQTNWTDEDLSVLELHLGSENVIPFYSLLPVLEYELEYEASCDYVVINADGDNIDYVDQYADICAENGYTLVLEEEGYASLSKTIVDDETKTSIQYIDIYVDLGMFTIDTYIRTTYYSASWPTNPSVKSLLGIDFSIVEYNSSDVIKTEYADYTLNYTTFVDVKVYTNVNSANEDYIASLVDNDYVLDFNKTTSKDYLYYFIGTYQSDDEELRYVIETEVSKAVVLEDDGLYSFNITFSCVIEY